MDSTAIGIEAEEILDYVLNIKTKYLLWNIKIRNALFIFYNQM